MKELNQQQSSELESKLELFEKHIEYSIEMAKDDDKKSIENGEYNYLIENHNIMENVVLSEELDESLNLSSLSKEQLIEKAIDDGNFEMEYEELSSPFQYGGSKENEFYCLQWGGDREYQLDKSSIEEYLLSFSLKGLFENYKEFEEFVNYNIGRSEYLKEYWAFSTTDLSHQNVTYNTDYDVVRCLLTNEEELIKFLKENVKTEEPFVKKTLKVTMEEYNDLRENYDGFCIKCGKINEGNHEPDAEKYECSHCEARESYGVEFLFMGGQIEIVESQDESTLDDSY